MPPAALPVEFCLLLSEAGAFNSAGGEAGYTSLVRVASSSLLASRLAVALCIMSSRAYACLIRYFSCQIASASIACCSSAALFYSYLSRARCPRDSLSSLSIFFNCSCTTFFAFFGLNLSLVAVGRSKSVLSALKPKKRLAEPFIKFVG